MNWTNPSPPAKNVNHNNHCFCETPIGTFFVEWGYSELRNFFYLSLNDEDLEIFNTLDEAKESARTYLSNKSREIDVFLGSRKLDLSEFDKLNVVTTVELIAENVQITN